MLFTVSGFQLDILIAIDVSQAGSNLPSALILVREKNELKEGMRLQVTNYLIDTALGELSTCYGGQLTEKISYTAYKYDTSAVAFVESILPETFANAQQYFSLLTQCNARRCQ